MTYVAVWVLSIKGYFQDHGQHQIGVASSTGHSVLFLYLQKVLGSEIPGDGIRSTFTFSLLFCQRVKEKRQEITDRNVSGSCSAGWKQYHSNRGSFCIENVVTFTI